MKSCMARLRKLGIFPSKMAGRVRRKELELTRDSLENDGNMYWSDKEGRR